MKRIRHQRVFAFALAATFPSSPAWALEPPVDEEVGDVEPIQPPGDAEGEGETVEAKNVIGTKGMVVRKLVPGHTEQNATEVGGAIFYERMLVDGILAVEGNLGILSAIDHGNVYAADLAFKIPFDAHANVEPYVGVGGAAVYETAHDHDIFAAGGFVTVGSFFWVDQHFGFDAEVLYTMLDEEGAVAHEITGATGAVAGF